MNSGLVTKEGSAVALLGVDIEAALVGATTRVAVTQRYKNAESTPIEAIYTFPLTSTATLVGFTMTVNGRRLEGRVMERDAAFQKYDEALYQGHGAALLDQERPNVFTANIGNLLPGEETLICVTYIELAHADEGALELRIPTLVAPRYIPGAAQPSALPHSGHGVVAPTERVPDADRISPPMGDARYGVTFRLTVTQGSPAHAYRGHHAIEIASPSHALSVGTTAEGMVATFATAHVSLDRDIVVSIRRADDAPFASVDAHRTTPQDGTVAITFVPRFLLEGAKRAAQDIVFVVDTSGSMDGTSLNQAKQALKLCLRQLSEGDRFTILSFSSQWSAMGATSPGTMLERVRAAVTGGASAPRLFAYDQESLAAADRYIDGLVAQGGTELLAPLVAAVELAPNGVVVLLTDGQVGNEAEIAEHVFRVRKSARLYNFGIGTNVSDALLRELAVRSGGALSFIYPGEPIQEKVVGQFSRAFSERVTDVRVETTGVELVQRAPASPRDIVDGDPWTFFARYERAGEGQVRVTGKRSNGATFAIDLPVRLPEQQGAPFVQQLWAKEHIQELERSVAHGANDRRSEAQRKRIVELAEKHQIGCAAVSFVVVEEREGDRRGSGAPETRVIPVSSPHGWAQSGGMDLMYSASSGAPAPGGGGYDGMSLGSSDASRAPSAAGAIPEGSRARFSKAPAMVRADRGAPPPPPSGSPAPMASYGAAQDDASVVLLLQQEASGLWPGRSDVERVRRTIEAILVLREEGIDAAHPMYGAQIRKAASSLTALAARFDAAEAETARNALAAAWLISGDKARLAISATAQQKHALLLQDASDVAAGLRAWCEVSR